MNTRNFILILTGIISSLNGFPQSDDSGSAMGTSKPNLKAAYNSSMIYPGVRLGAEFQLNTFKTTTLKKSGKCNDLIKGRFINTNLGWYHQTDFHDNLYLTAGWTMRRTRSDGFFTEFSPEIGVSRTFVGGTTYQVDVNGRVSVEKFSGYFYPLCSVGGGIGYDFSITESKPLMLYYKLNLLAMYPYNSTIYIRPAMELGVIYRIYSNHL